MTEVENNLAIELVKEHFGEIVSNVTRCLMSGGSMQLGEIFRHVKENRECVKNALLVLVQHNFVTYEKTMRGFYLYRLDTSSILHMTRYPSIVHVSRHLFGVNGGLLITEILEKGKVTMQQMIEAVQKRHEEAAKKSPSRNELATLFETIVNERFVCRCPVLVAKIDEKTGNSLSVFAADKDYLFVVPCEELEDERPAKRMKMDKENSEEKDKTQEEVIYWMVHFERFNLYFRDRIIVNAIRRKIDENGATIIETMLKVVEDFKDPWNPTSIPINRFEIIKNLPKNKPIDQRILDQYFALLTDDSVGILTKVGDHQGGVYSLQFRNFIMNLAWTMVEKVIEERFSSKHCRIFRLLRNHNYLEQREIEKFAMIPAKDAKEMTYSLLMEEFIHTQDVPQTNEYIPTKTFYLFCIRFRQLARIQLQWCFKSLFNLKLRREFELKQNKRVLDKKNKVDELVRILKSQNADPVQITEIEEQITPPEIAQLDRVTSATDKLESGELQLADSISVFQFCVTYFSK